MILRADIEESKSNVAMNAWLPQASYPCGNFSDTSCWKLAKSKGSIGHAFAVRIRTGNANQVGFCPFARDEISVLMEPTFGHLRYRLTDVPPQPNSPPELFCREGPAGVGGSFGPEEAAAPCEAAACPSSRRERISASGCGISLSPVARLPHMLHPNGQSTNQTRVKLNRVFFPLFFAQARSLGCGFARWLIGTVGISLILSCASLISLLLDYAFGVAFRLEKSNTHALLASALHPPHRCRPLGAGTRARTGLRRLLLGASAQWRRVAVAIQWISVT